MRLVSLGIVLGTAVTGCGDKSTGDSGDEGSGDEGSDDTGDPVDADGDGAEAWEDCDGTIDNDASDPSIWYADADSDGHGDAKSTQEGCSEPAGYVTAADDCDESDSDVSPSDAESCSSGADDDCDGLVDCEDADCLSSCSELDCEDGLDDDGDGDIDCDDTECWVLQPCAGTVLSASATAGKASGGALLEVRYYPTFKWSSGRTARFSDETWHATVSSVSGTVQVSTTAGSLNTCTWTVDVARMSFVGTQFASVSSTNHGETMMPVTRSGFAASSGCPVQTSGFQPTCLAPMISGPYGAVSLAPGTSTHSGRTLHDGT